MGDELCAILRDQVFIVRHESGDNTKRWPDWQRYDAFNTLIEAVAGADECLHERWEALGDCAGCVEIVGYPSGASVDIREIDDLLTKFWNDLSNVDDSGDSDDPYAQVKAKLEALE